jgi:hypothetical protein
VQENHQNCTRASESQMQWVSADKNILNKRLQITETSGEGKLFDHFHESYVSHRFSISGKQVPAQTSEPGLHLE